MWRGGVEPEKQRWEAEEMVYAAYLAKDYPRIIELVDSLRPLERLSEGKACYWLGYAYDRMIQLGRIEYCNAGHNPPVIGNADAQFSFLDIEEANAPIGLWTDLEYVGDEMLLPSGSMMLLYTDGLNEAENRQQEQYGEDRIIQLLTSHASYSARNLIDALKADADQFRDGAEQSDDLTMLCVRLS